MPMLKSLNPMCLMLFAFIGLLLIYYLGTLVKQKPNNLMLYVILIGLAAFTLLKRNELKRTVRNFCYRSQTTQIDYFYDTDPDNNIFIKADLTPRQFLLLDRILMDEKSSDGLELSHLRLKELARNDNDVIEAYERWRKCKNMNRSYHTVVYPDERATMKSRRR